MKWLILFCAFSSFVEAAQTPPTYDPTELLLNVRKKVMATVDRLPSYLCTETVNRTTLLPEADTAGLSCDDLARLRQKPSWKLHKGESDRLEFNVAVSKEGEMYSLSGENRFHADNPASLFGRGVTSTGAFGIFLRGIFASDAATFTYAGDSDFNGRRLAEFAYSVALDQGGYSVDTRVRDKTYRDVVPYDGTFLADPQTFDLVRLTVRAGQLPKEHKICGITTTLDYTNMRLNGSEFLLPQNARLRVDNDDGSESENTSTFSSCHEFGSESKLLFGTSAGSGPAVSVRRNSEQSDLPALQADRQAQLTAVRKKVMATVGRLPKYLCTETIDRSTFLPRAALPKRDCADLTSRKKAANWKMRQGDSDRLRLDVAVSEDEGEMYSWVGENRFHDRSLADLVGSGVTSTGAFGVLLGAIFGSDAAIFTFNGDKNFNGRTLVEFGFRVPLERSNYDVGNKKDSAIVPYAGIFLIDPQTFDLVRLVIHADQLPEQLHVCDDATTLDYASVRLNDAEFLLPRNALLHINYDDGSESDNRTVFSACHEFLGESTLSFDMPASSQPEASARSAPKPLTLPAGLRFALALTSPIETETAAAGDVITAKLTTPIREKHNNVLVPKGAAITGRIVQIVRLYDPPSLVVAIRLETIESDGVPQPFAARLATVVKRASDSLHPGGRIVQQTLGSFNQMPQINGSAVGIVRIADVTKDYVIHRGLELEGTTIAAQP